MLRFKEELPLLVNTVSRTRSIFVFDIHLPYPTKTLPIHPARPALPTVTAPRCDELPRAANRERFATERKQG